MDYTQSTILEFYVFKVTVLRVVNDEMIQLYEAGSDNDVYGQFLKGKLTNIQ